MIKLKVITPDIESIIVEIARVSSSRDDKKADPDKLINYLIKNKHWSPFEHGFITFHITTSRAIGAQLLRHRSFTFQELSQRYANVSDMLGSDLFQNIETRKAGSTNRQSSLEVFDPVLFTIEKKEINSSEVIDLHLNNCKNLYDKLISKGVATECARIVLPLCTTTEIYMTGSVRSWIHFLELRDDDHAQKEVRLLAQDIKKIFKENLPNVSKALNY